MGLTFADKGIRIPNGARGEVKTLCPKCSHLRKPQHQNEPCLNANVEGRMWNCHNCGWTGSLQQREWKPIEHISRTPASNIYTFFEGRGIPREVVDRNRITEAMHYFPNIGNRKAICFNYYASGVKVNVKFRSSTKNFALVKDAEKIAYGIDDLGGALHGIIVEGEIDKLSCEAAGYRNAVSVPNGGINPGDKQVAKKLQFIEHHLATFDALETITLAVDSDEVGVRLRDELATRFGPERCLTVTWPAGCKDANDVLRQHGAATLAACIAGAKPYPIPGVIRADDIRDSLFANRRKGAMVSGVDPHIWNQGADVVPAFSLKLRHQTVIHGKPNDGKSPLRRQIELNTALYHGWTWGVYSPEETVDEQVACYVEQLIGLPYSEDFPAAMSDVWLGKATDFVHEHFFFLDNDDGDMPVPKLLEKWDNLARRFGVCGFSIDPWQYMLASLEGRQTEHDFIGKSLRAMKLSLKRNNAHGIIVAHDTKLPKVGGKTEIARPSDIAQSSHFYSLPWNILLVEREIDDNGADLGTRLHVQKVKDKHAGRRGILELRYDVTCSRFRDAGLRDPERRNLLIGGEQVALGMPPDYLAPQFMPATEEAF